MQLAIAIVLIGVVFVLENAPKEPIEGCLLHVLLVLVASASVVGFAMIGSMAISFCGECTTSQESTVTSTRRVRAFHIALWIAASGAILYGLGWTQIVRFNWQLDGTFLLDELLVFAPVLLPLIFSWAAFFYADRWAYGNHYEKGLMHHLILHARHHLVLILIPIFLILAAHDLVGLSASRGVWMNTTYAGALSLLLISFPFILRLIWQTEPLRASRIRERLVRTSQQVDLKYRELLIWKSDDRIVNAAVAGIVAPLRYVFLSDGLLRYLTPGEIEAVFLHEAAHVRRRHVWWRLLAFTPPILIWLIRNRLVSQPQPLSTDLCWAIGVFLYATIALCLVSRRLEFDADQWALQQIQRMPHEIGERHLFTALEKLARVGAGRNHNSWLHPSVAQRVAMLESALRDPTISRVLQYRTNILCWCLLMTFAAALTVMIVVSN